MSQIEQWARDAVAEMRQAYKDSDGMTEAVADGLYAAIITRHAILAGLVQEIPANTGPTVGV